MFVLIETTMGVSRGGQKGALAPLTDRNSMFFGFFLKESSMFLGIF